MIVLSGFLDSWQRRSRCLSLSGIACVSILAFTVAGNIMGLALDLLFQDLEVKVPQRIGTETAALEAFGG